MAIIRKGTADWCRASACATVPHFYHFSSQYLVILTLGDPSTKLIFRFLTQINEQPKKTYSYSFQGQSVLAGPVNSDLLQA